MQAVAPALGQLKPWELPGGPLAPGEYERLYGQQGGAGMRDFWALLGERREVREERVRRERRERPVEVKPAEAEKIPRQRRERAAAPVEVEAEAGYEQMQSEPGPIDSFFTPVSGGLSVEGIDPVFPIGVTAEDTPAPAAKGAKKNGEQLFLGGLVALLYLL